jgi:HEAT repeat protein
MIRKSDLSTAVVALLVVAVVMSLFGRTAWQLVRGIRMSASLKALGPADAAAVPRVVAMLNDPNPLVREAAATALGQIGPAAEVARPRLFQALRDTHPGTRAWSLGALGPTPSTVRSLIQALDDNDPEVRRYAAYALFLYGPPAEPAIPKLTEALNDPHMRYMAADALGAIGQAAKGTVPQILAAMRAETSIARADFAKALGKFGSEAKEAVPDLRSLENDPDSMVKRAARDALMSINSAPMPAAGNGNSAR